MILYHGSNMKIESINLAMCRPYKDFGRGFYLTDMKEQSERMAQRVARIYGGSPVLNVFEIQDGFTRIPDIVIGPVADDNMALLFRQYENEVIDFETLLKGMIYKETSSQYSFHTEKSIRLLRKVADEIEYVGTIN